MNKEQITKEMFSITTYAIGDIKANNKMPIAAFILGTQLINALSWHRYGGMIDFIRFVNDYMPQYDGEKLHDSLNRRLLPYYSLRGGYYKIGWGDRNKEENLEEGTIHVDDFIESIEKAISKFVEDLKDGVFDLISGHPFLQDKS